MRIITRAEWGAVAPKDRQLVGWAQRTGVVYHHSTGNNLGQPTTAGWLRAIQRFHMVTRGWSDIGYNHACDRYGNLYELRGWNVIGAHVLGFNTPNLGIVYLGDTNRPDNGPTEAARTTLAWYLGESRQRAKKSLRALGHGQLGNTDCPGAALRAWLAAGLPVPNPGPVTTWTEGLIMQLPTLKMGSGDSRGNGTVQSLLNLPANGGTKANALVVDGDWGPKTDARFRAFQVAKHVPESVDNGVGDGVCGQHSWTALLPV